MSGAQRSPSRTAEKAACRRTARSTPRASNALQVARGLGSATVQPQPPAAFVVLLDPAAGVQGLQLAPHGLARDARNIGDARGRDRGAALGGCRIHPRAQRHLADHRQQQHLLQVAVEAAGDVDQVLGDELDEVALEGGLVLAESVLRRTGRGGRQHGACEPIEHAHSPLAHRMPGRPMSTPP